MRVYRLSALAFLLSVLGCVAWAESPYRICIENREGGRISVQSASGERFVGRVVRPVDAPDYFPFAASVFGKDSSITATAVNALHIRISEGKTFSILPRDTGDFGLGNLITDVSPGSAIFGPFAPRVGDAVELISTNGASRRLPANYIPAIGDRWRIHCPRASGTFESLSRTESGTAILEEGTGSRVLGTVLSPVRGVGRFEGSQFAGPGTVRANHPGVICVSVSPFGVTGGFQIVPKEHLEKNRLERYLGAPQWLTVDAPAGSLPLFSDCCVPATGFTAKTRRETRDRCRIGRPRRQGLEQNGNPAISRIVIVPESSPVVR
jgi:hypothetical protein